MKNIVPGFFLIILLTLFIACNNKRENPGAETLTPNSVFSWQVIYDDSSGNFEMKKTTQTGPDSLEASAVTDYMNSLNPNINLIFKKVSGDTVYLSIADASFLTEQMGSTGATNYMATVTYNFTEIPGIHFINLDFVEGDHAGPGVYQRSSFSEDFKSVQQ